jgi:broad specificity phosphatase PhoE
VRLYLVRHSLPDYGDDPENPPDDPPLTDDGRQYVQALADWMLDKDEVPNLIFSSDKLRTMETAEILRSTFGLPDVTPKASIGPQMSVKKLIERISADKSMTRVMIVSHHETIEHGLRFLDRDPLVHLDMMAMAEMRILKVDRKDSTWKEHRRIVPSDLGGRDNY